MKSQRSRYSATPAKDSACSVCRRSLRKRRVMLVDGEPHCAECALLIAIARAILPGPEVR